MLFFSVERVVIFNALLFFFLLEELKLFGCRVHVVDIGDVPVKEARVVVRIGGWGSAPRGVDRGVLECGETGFASLELFLYHG